MKKFVFLSILVLGSVAVQAQKVSSPEINVIAPNAIPVFKWLTNNVLVLGKIELNKPVSVSFEFINKGTAPLVISRVEPSCGCTAIEYSKEPVAPNQKGFVKTTYNAASIGVFEKTITVYANTSELSKVLTIKGEVVKK
jgi:hypothetical protein